MPLLLHQTVVPAQSSLSSSTSTSRLRPVHTRIHTHHLSKIIRLQRISILMKNWQNDENWPSRRKY